MELKYKGKTKDVYTLPNNRILLKFKDDVTGVNGIFDPGANTVGLSVQGAGRSGLRVTKHFFELLATKGIKTHYISVDINEASMIVKEAKPFGKGLEVICRFRAVGSFFKRYGAYCTKGQTLDKLVEITIKDDDRGDPPISKDSLAMLGILTNDEYEILRQKMQVVCEIIKNDLASAGLDLYDIKLEFGRDAVTGEIILIDEISGGNMRVYKNDVYLPPLDLERQFLGSKEN